MNDTYLHTKVHPYVDRFLKSKTNSTAAANLWQAFLHSLAYRVRPLTRHMEDPGIQNASYSAGSLKTRGTASLEFNHRLPSCRNYAVPLTACQEALTVVVATSVVATVIASRVGVVVTIVVPPAAI